MAARLGNKEKFYIRTVYTDTSTTPSTTAYHFAWLGCETANSLNRTAEAVECSDKSSNWAKFIAGKLGATIEATAYADNEDEQQAALLDALHTGLKVWVFTGQAEPSESDAEDDEIIEGDLMQGVVTAVSDTNDFGAVASRNFSLTVDGEVTHYDEEEPEVEE